MKRAILTASAVMLVLALAACGNNSNNPPNNPSVTVSPATANVQEGSQQQFTATVSNTNDNAITWQVNGVTGGNSSVGTISSTGLYTAPSVIPNPASVTITALITDMTTVSGSSIVTITAVTFGNSSLKGNFVFGVSGLDLNANPFYAVGAITADGNGNITAGEEDIVDTSSGYVNATTMTGTYSVGADGRGTLTFSNSIGQFQFAIALKAMSNAVLNETDNGVVAATGTLEAQATSIAAPSGNYAFGFSGSGLGCGSVNSAGIFNMGGTTIGGTQDLNCGGTIVKSQAVSGTYGAIDGLGRGTGSFSGSSTGSSNIIYYVVSSGRFRFLADPNNPSFLLGSADLQTQPSFAATDFNGSYVINSSANTNAGVSYTLIQINASGGNVSSGYFDVNDTGTQGSATLSGSYSLGSNGYITGTWNVNNASLPFAMYLFSPTQGYYVDERTNAVGGGNIYAQSGSVTTNAAWAGSFATKQFGYFIVNGILNNSNASGVSGQISADGNGTLAGTLDLNDPAGVYIGQTLQGSYSVGTVAPGRMTLTITTSAEGTRSYTGYIVSQNQILLLETDNNLTSGGDAIKQF
jgi:predicted small lipoprotein YifL